MALKLVSVKLSGFCLAWPTFSFGFYSHVSDNEPGRMKILRGLHTLKSCCFSFFFLALAPMVADLS